MGVYTPNNIVEINRTVSILIGVRYSTLDTNSANTVYAT